MDPAPLAATIDRLVSFRQLGRNLADGALRAAAVVATSGLTSRSVVFHGGEGTPAADHKRGIDYIPAKLASAHVRASAAIPAIFPAVEVREPAAARGWYFDGGTRLNTPLKPALSLGARKVIVIGLNSIAPGPPDIASRDRPDLYAGASQLIQAVLVDPLINDVRTLATINGLVSDDAAEDGRRTVPYVFIAPAEREAVGALAAEVYRDRYTGLRGSRRSPDLALIGRLVNAGASPMHGELLSYLFFAPEFTDALIELGRRDARSWLAAEHHDGPWRVGPLPGEQTDAEANDAAVAGRT
jgi:NTE family protein